MFYYDINLYNASKNLFQNTLFEDTNNNDIISNIIPNRKDQAYIQANDRGVFVGEIFSIVLEKDFGIKSCSLKDGEEFTKGTKIFSLEGSAKMLLSIERTLLNILTILISISTTTREFVNATEGKFGILDTRKTIPGLRFFQKYAVRVGGGVNHRFGLYDMIMIKDNHIVVFEGDIQKLVRMAKEYSPMHKVEVECENMEQVKKAVEAGADVIMLDNMSVNDIKASAEYIKSINPNIIVEASGNIDIDKIRDLVKVNAPIDFVSSSKLTMSFKVVDLSFVIE
ncbi:MAG: carboxylating nicotinate-nucleotide diphosphorylase [Brevinematales bacterium]|nr:carboxylating nicotinate-nucleotide diphosphorylase [Brevinematales bacterium]